MQEKLEGVILEARPHLENALLVKLFSPKGILSFYKKRISHKERSSFSPLTKMEIVYWKKEEGLLSIRDYSPLSYHFDLRSSLARLQSAGEMAQALLRSQMAEKEAPLLYQLFTLYLKQLEKTEKPDCYLASFLLKLLVHEGLLQPSSKCTLCDRAAGLFLSGEPRCREHSSREGLFFREEEWASLLVLAGARSFHEVESRKPPLDKIRTLFKDLIR